MLSTLRNLFAGGGKPAKERRRLPAAGPCPNPGASVVRRNLAMKVTEPISREFWDWLVLVGWREVRMAKNRRRYKTLPADTFGRLARATPAMRDALYRELIGS